MEDIKLEWQPDYIDVAISSDLAYTYGHYTFSATASDGKPIIAYTIWKK